MAICKLCGEEIKETKSGIPMPTKHHTAGKNSTATRQQRMKLECKCGIRMEWRDEPEKK